MVTNVFVNIHYPEASIYADLNGIRNDLRAVKDFSQELKSVHQRVNSGERGLGLVLMFDALNTAILTRYGRSFTGGVRKELTIIEKDIITSLSPELQTAHQTFLLLRDKHIAHSVDECEQNQPHARYLVEKLKEDGFISIGCNSTVLYGMSMQDIETMIILTTELLGKLDKRIKKEEAELLEFVRNKPVEEVLKNGDPHLPTPMRIGKVRKQKK